MTSRETITARSNRRGSGALTALFGSALRRQA